MSPATSPTMHAPAPRQEPVRVASPAARVAAPRRDIQALRALAVSLVVLYHFWPKRLSGGYVGVDVFFVISGFLITTHLLDHVPASGRDLAEFWGRRIRRLLPASFTVVAATLAAAWWLAPATYWDNTARQAVSSAFYVQNWVLAHDAVDYLAADNAATPVQHFWSLSVEEQFYLVWPLLLLLTGMVARRRGMSVRRLAAVAVALVVVVSLACSVMVTDASAYFVTYTRMWELGLGGVVAVLAPRLTRLPDPARVVLVWTGLALVVGSALVLDASTPFPGVAALLPVGGTALAIAADVRRGLLSPLALMSLRPVQQLGDLSYAIYLWHWPLVVLLPFALHGPVPGVVKLFALCAVVLVAWASKLVVEDPLRGRTPLGRPLRRSFVFALAGALVVAGGGLLLHQRSVDQSRQVAAPAPGEDACYAAAALTSKGCDPHGSRMYLPPLAAAKDRSPLFDNGCVMQMTDTSHRTCELGSRAKDAKEVALVGNSHAAMWAPAIDRIAKERNWHVTTYLMYECYTVDRPISLPPAGATRACQGWNRYVVGRVARSDADLVVVSNRYYRQMAGAATPAQSLRMAQQSSRRILRTWHRAGRRVLVIKDPPAPPTANTPDCVAAQLRDLSRCDGSLRRSATPDPMADAAGALHLDGVGTVDPHRWFCRERRCYATIGGVVAYYDASHVTTTYVKSLTGRLRPVLTAAMHARAGTSRGERPTS